MKGHLLNARHQHCVLNKTCSKCSEFACNFQGIQLYSALLCSPHRRHKCWDVVVYAISSWAKFILVLKTYYVTVVHTQWVFSVECADSATALPLQSNLSWAIRQNLWHSETQELWHTVTLNHIYMKRVYKYQVCVWGLGNFCRGCTSFSIELLFRAWLFPGFCASGQGVIKS